MIGSEGQIQWARQIQATIGPEFDRVAAAFREVADRQQGLDRRDTLAIIAILEEKRGEVLANEHAGYFVHDWQELHDQVRQLLLKDSRYLTIQGERQARKRIQKEATC